MNKIILNPSRGVRAYTGTNKDGEAYAFVVLRGVMEDGTSCKVVFNTACLYDGITKGHKLFDTITVRGIAKATPFTGRDGSTVNDHTVTDPLPVSAEPSVYNSEVFWPSWSDLIKVAEEENRRRAAKKAAEDAELAELA